MRIRFRTIALIPLVIISLVLTAIPDPVANFINSVLGLASSSTGLTFGPIGIEPVSRFFGVLCPIFVGFLSFEFGQQIEAARSARLVPIPVRFRFNPTGLQEPYRSIVLYTQLPSFMNDSDTALQHLEKSIILANHKLISAPDQQNLNNALNNPSVVGLILDTSFRDEALRRAQQGPTVYLAEPHTSYGATMGRPITLRIGGDMLNNRSIYQTALALSKAYVPDVAKSVGFHGTWATTYGLLAIREDLAGKASGVYYYGSGKIRDGVVTVNVADNMISLRFKWDQSSNSSGTGAVGTRNRGDGEFQMFAGSESFSGIGIAIWTQGMLSCGVERACRVTLSGIFDPEEPSIKHLG